MAAARANAPLVICRSNSRTGHRLDPVNRQRVAFPGISYLAPNGFSDFDRVIVGHGEVMESDGKAKLRATSDAAGLPSA